MDDAPISGLMTIKNETEVKTEESETFSDHSGSGNLEVSKFHWSLVFPFENELSILISFLL